MNKDNLRVYAINLRKSIDMEEFSQKLVKKISEHEFFMKANDILLYYPLKNEPNLLDLMKLKKNFYLPRVKGDEMEVCPYGVGDKLEKSFFSVMEPVVKSVNPDILNLVIVPALMADKSGYRLGFGKGYYDRFLKSKNVKTICVVPKELYVKELPHDEFDKKIDVVLTD